MVDEWLGSDKRKRGACTDSQMGGTGSLTGNEITLLVLVLKRLLLSTRLYLKLGFLMISMLMTKLQKLLLLSLLILVSVLSMLMLRSRCLQFCGDSWDNKICWLHGPNEATNKQLNSKRMDGELGNGYDRKTVETTTSMVDKQNTSNNGGTSNNNSTNRSQVHRTID